MIKIAFPAYQPKIKTIKSKEMIFDSVRQRWVMLTPEEWVRQNFLQYLVQVKKIPIKLIAVEKEIRLVELKKRFDIVVYDQSSKPWMIIECKEMNVPLDKQVLDQVLRYNIILQVPYLVITNGTDCIAYLSDKGQLVELKDLPAY